MAQTPNTRRLLLGFIWALAGCVSALAVEDEAPTRPSPTASARTHWAFQPVQRPPVPAVRNGGWVRNPIDAFVLSRLEARGWTPSPSASPTALLRRAHLDLAGFPPALEEQERFERDPSPLRLEHVLDDLLSRPSYGDRWARHWLDLVRYADSNGYERDAEKPFVWRYRDYVIGALNADRPYDQFLREQLAGDELPQVRAETLVATTFARLGHWDDEPADPVADRFDQLDDIVSTTSQAILGLTLGCARCHDHKFEPLTAADYYRMVAVFAPLQRPQNGRTELTLPLGSAVEREAVALRDREIAAVQRRTNDLSPQAITAHVAALRREVPDLPAGYILQETGGTVPPTHVLMRGNPGRPGEVVTAGIPSVLPGAGWTPPRSVGSTSGRRRALVEWMVSSDNPLTARVIVNRVWQQHFGAGLVRTPSDFGVMGEPPTHPELLDWLSHWFVHDAGWSLKALHRLILSSNTWRMGRTQQPVPASEDPENRLLWHQPYRRLEVEALRDSMLAVSGELNRQAGGRGVFLPIPRAAMEANTDKDSIWSASPPDQAARRTVYAFVKRGLVVPMLEVLDLCDTVSSSARRQVTTVAPQALTLFNGEFVNQQAACLADRVVREVGTDPERQVDHLSRLALGRLPSAGEREAYLGFLRALEPREPRERLVQVARVVLNLNEFAYPE